MCVEGFILILRQLTKDMQASREITVIQENKDGKATFLLAPKTF